MEHYLYQETSLLTNESFILGEYLTLQKKTFYEAPGTRVALHGKWQWLCWTENVT